MSRKIRIFLLSCVLIVVCCMGITVGASDTAKAEIVGHNLTITDNGISVNFYVDIQGDVQVTLNNSQVTTLPEQETVIIDAKAYNCYKFTQPVVAKEMDKKVSLIIKSGDNTLVNDSYCVNDYAANVIGDKYNYNYEELVKAMTYYGDFAEVYLNYNATQADEAEGYLANFDATAKEDLVGSKYQMSQGSEYSTTGLEYNGMQLNLVSEISLRLRFTPTNDAAMDYEFTAVSEDGTKNLGTLKEGTYNGTEYYYVDIENIGADALDKSYTITADGKEVISNCSVLSYARAVVKTYVDEAGNITEGKADLVNLAKALYLYNQKADTYVLSQTAAVKDIFYSNEGFSATPDEFTPVYLTGNGDATTEEMDEKDKVTTLAQLNGSRTKGCSIWMKEAYTVAADENVTTGPYVIRRYTGNEGNVLNVAGTATLNTKVDGSLGNFVAKYPGGTATVSFESNGSVAAGNSLVNVAAGATFTINDTSIQNSHVENGEVYVSGTPAAFNITGGAKSGVVTVASGVTGVTINVDGLTATGEEEQVVLASHAGQSLTGNGEASAITLIDDGDEHFGVVKHNNNVRIASVICVCGDDVTGEASHDNCPWAGENGIAAVYDITWKAHTATTGYMPGYNSAGYYYLTNNLKLSGQGNITVTSYLDLNGKIISCSDSTRNIALRTEGIAYSIADSKEGGTIKVSETYAYTAGYGGVIWCGKAATFNMYGGTIDMTNTDAAPTNPESSSDEWYLIDVAGEGGTFAVYGGEIKPAQNGDCIGLRGNANIIVLGGTIYGDVILRNATDSVTVGGNAKVGLPQTNESTSYGINAWAASSMVCDNLNKDAKIILTKQGTIKLSEKEDSDSLVSGFELVTGGKDGHYGVVKKKDGTLDFATTICVCGENVSDNHNHTCAWVESQTNGIADVYSINWQAHTTASGTVPGTSESGFYYLTDDFTMTRSDVTAQSCLDLNGKTITATYSTLNFYIKENANYSIGDSKNGQGTIKLPETSAVAEAYGVMINVAVGGQVNLYSGTIDMTAASYAMYQPIDVKGTFNMHGGIIKPVQDTKYGNCINLRNKGSLSVDGGIIYGQIVLQTTTETLTVADDAKVGLPILINGNTLANGITDWQTAASLISKGVNEDAQIIIVSKTIVLSGTGVASAFTVPTGYEIVVADDGTLSMAKK